MSLIGAHVAIVQQWRLRSNVTVVGKLLNLQKNNTRTGKKCVILEEKGGRAIKLELNFKKPSFKNIDVIE